MSVARSPLFHVVSAAHLTTQKLCTLCKPCLLDCYSELKDADTSMANDSMAYYTNLQHKAVASRIGSPLLEIRAMPFLKHRCIVELRLVHRLASIMQFSHRVLHYLQHVFDFV